MSVPLGYLEQSKLDNRLQVLQRECAELRWALSSRELYEAEAARLAEMKAELEKQAAEDEA